MAHARPFMAAGEQHCSSAGGDYADSSAPGQNAQAFVVSKG
jgi:hypothetical protein